ncbi:dnaJ homolog subfamily B member 1-like [Metopolophium dirhodum]|uniref:dnaJ homolog subfamily B member 1-like n=1 Tax=Metopolophium dirhodum TaxID=44670 RepID=UPI0029904438|nr:dnaJ homolog subfamily B member 1-like [Metopolophium dirhodum]
MYNCREYCTLNNPITNLFIKSNGSVVIDLKKDKGGPDIVKLRLQLTLNEIFNGSIKLVELKRNPSTLCDSISNKLQVLKINIPRGFPTGGTIKSEVSRPDIGYNNVKTVYIFTTEDLPHKVFKRDNMNLIMVQKVLLKQLLLGIRIVINTLDHKVLRVNITEVITQDYVKVIHNEGMPDMNDPSKRGDLIIQFDIIYPLYLPISDNTLICESLNDKKINT